LASSLKRIKAKQSAVPTEADTFEELEHMRRI